MKEEKQIVEKEVDEQIKKDMEMNEKFSWELLALQNKYSVELYAANIILPNWELTTLIKYKKVWK